MTMTTLTDFMPTARARSQGFVRSALCRALEPRERLSRRHAGFDVALCGTDRWDVSQIERQSLFDAAAPERR